MVKIGTVRHDTRTKRRVHRSSTWLFPSRTEEMRAFVKPSASRDQCREREDPNVQQGLLEMEALRLLAWGRNHRMASTCNQTDRNAIGYPRLRCRT